MKLIPSMAYIMPFMPRKEITAEDIIDIVCRHFNVEKENICKHGRQQENMIPRQTCMYYIRKHLSKQYSLKKTGAMFGRFDHTTVIHSCSQIENYLKIGAYYADDILKVGRLIEQSKVIELIINEPNI